MYEFAGRFHREDLFLKEFKYWILLLRPVPVTLGSSIILLKRECPSFSQITSEEMAEFPLVCSFFENRCKTLYGALKFNYHANMMKENFVHFHAFPRYDKSIERYCIRWEDKDWPKKCSANYTMEVSDSVLYDIRYDFLEGSL